MNGSASLPTAPRVERFLSRDVDEVATVGGKLLAPHRLRMAKGETGLDASFSRVKIGPIAIIDICYGGGVDVDVENLGGCYLVHSSRSGASELRASGQTVRLHPDTMAVTSPDHDLSLRISRACHHLTVRLEQESLKNHLRALINRDVSKPLTFAVDIGPSSPFIEAWQNLIGHICQQFWTMPEMFHNPRIQGNYASLLMELLLYKHAHNYRDMLEQSRNDISPWHVRRARDIIESRTSDLLSIEEIAREVGVSTRCLQKGFRDFLGMSPGEYMRKVRLAIVHEALRQADSRRTVTDIMLEHNVVNFGRFAQYYKQAYGCKPSDTLRRPPSA